MTLRDASDFRNTFLYKLSQNGAFALFRNVLLVGSIQDLYVPSHSALIEQCKASMVDQTDLKNVYTEMLSNINESIVASPCHTIVVKYCVAHAVSNVSKAQQVTGRAGNIFNILNIRGVFNKKFIFKLSFKKHLSYYD